MVNGYVGSMPRPVLPAVTLVMPDTWKYLVSRWRYQKLLFRFCGDAPARENGKKRCPSTISAVVLY